MNISSSPTALAGGMMKRGTPSAPGSHSHAARNARPIAPDARTAGCARRPQAERGPERGRAVIASARDELVGEELLDRGRAADDAFAQVELLQRAQLVGIERADARLAGVDVLRIGADRRCHL